MSQVLITGGAGFIGSHTADALLRQGHQVRILDSLDPQIHGDTTAFPAYLHPAVECVRGDVRDARLLAEVLDGVELVYHLAALTGVGQSMYDIRHYVDVNTVGMAMLLEVLIKRQQPLQRLVLSSSRAVYGEGTHRCPVHGPLYPPVRQRADLEQGRFEVFCPQCGTPMTAMPTAEERPLHPVSVYALTKQHQEDYCQHVAATFGLPVTILRYFNVYGSRQSLRNPYTGVMSIFYSRLLSGQPIALYEQGRPGRDFVHVTDVAQANVRAAAAAVPPGSVINVGTGVDYTIVEVARTLAAACGREPVLEDKGEFRVGDIHACYADLSRAQSLLGYQPQVSLQDGIKEFVAWASGQPVVDLYEKTVTELKNHGLFGSAAPSS